ncbi:MAG: hypothetical protein ACRC28_17035 [Clostridium sp.]|uniref:hypothetical protein n=1 Tax=Clostridium sp. TaxID=1506 RepID=UPI003F2EF1BE
MKEAVREKRSGITENEELSLILQDIKNDKEDILKEVYSLEILHKEELNNRWYKNKKSNGKYEDNCWLLKNELYQSYNCIDFNELISKKYSLISSQKRYVDIVKLFLLGEILNRCEDGELGGAKSGNIVQKFKAIMKFLKETNFLKENFLDNINGDKIDRYYQQINGSDSYKKDKFKKILEFLNFSIQYFTTEENKIAIKYINRMIPYAKGLKVGKTRELPNAMDIVIFSCYIDKFLNDESINEKIKLQYMPVVLWWKITSIIPIRPSEFARKIPRNAVFEKDGIYYLRIDRVKKKANQRKTLPILKELTINKETYELINQYIEKTNEYGESTTLISYLAYKSMCKHGVRRYKEFTSAIMNELIKNFYKNIVQKMYNESRELEKLKCGDTRHIAFTNLKLQGYSPIEIAIMGGHQSLMSSNHYTDTPSVYVGLQTLSLVRQSITFKTNDSRSLQELFEQMPKKCPISIEHCFGTVFGEDDIEIGLCTGYYNSVEDPCEDSNNCEKCSKWWCEPTEDNYKKLSKIKQKELNKRENKLTEDIEFMRGLLERIGLDYSTDTLELDMEINKLIKSTSLRLKSNSKAITHLTYELLDRYSEDYRLLTEIDEILPQEEVSRILKNISEREDNN